MHTAYTQPTATATTTLKQQRQSLCRRTHVGSDSICRICMLNDIYILNKLLAPQTVLLLSPSAPSCPSTAPTPTPLRQAALVSQKKRPMGCSTRTVALAVCLLLAATVSADTAATDAAAADAAALQPVDGTEVAAQACGGDDSSPSHPHSSSHASSSSSAEAHPAPSTAAAEAAVADAPEASSAVLRSTDDAAVSRAADPTATKAAEMPPAADAAAAAAAPLSSDAAASQSVDAGAESRVAEAPASEPAAEAADAAAAAAAAKAVEDEPQLRTAAAAEQAAGEVAQEENTTEAANPDANDGGAPPPSSSSSPAAAAAAPPAEAEAETGAAETAAGAAPGSNATGTDDPPASSAASVDAAGGGSDADGEPSAEEDAASSSLSTTLTSTADVAPSSPFARDMENAAGAAADRLWLHNVFDTRFPLVVQDERLHWVPSGEAARILGGLKGGVAVVAAMGQAGVGASALLNAYVRRATGEGGRPLDSFAADDGAGAGAKGGASGVLLDPARLAAASGGGGGVASEVDLRGVSAVLAVALPPLPPSGDVFPQAAALAMLLPACRNLVVVAGDDGDFDAAVAMFALVSTHARRIVAAAALEATTATAAAASSEALSLEAALLLSPQPSLTLVRQATSLRPSEEGGGGSLVAALLPSSFRVEARRRRRVYEGTYVAAAHPAVLETTAALPLPAESLAALENPTKQTLDGLAPAYAARIASLTPALTRFALHGGDAADAGAGDEDLSLVAGERSGGGGGGGDASSRGVAAALGVGTAAVAAATPSDFYTGHPSGEAVVAAMHAVAASAEGEEAACPPVPTEAVRFSLRQAERVRARVLERAADGLRAGVAAVPPPTATQLRAAGERAGAAAQAVYAAMMPPPAAAAGATAAAGTAAVSSHGLRLADEVLALVPAMEEERAAAVETMYEGVTSRLAASVAEFACPALGGEPVTPDARARELFEAGLAARTDAAAVFAAVARYDEPGVPFHGAAAAAYAEAADAAAAAAVEANSARRAAALAAEADAAADAFEAATAESEAEGVWAVDVLDARLSAASARSEAAWTAACRAHEGCAQHAAAAGALRARLAAARTRRAEENDARLRAACAEAVAPAAARFEQQWAREHEAAAQLLPRGALRPRAARAVRVAAAALAEELAARYGEGAEVHAAAARAEAEARMTALVEEGLLPALEKRWAALVGSVTACAVGGGLNTTRWQAALSRPHVTQLVRASAEACYLSAAKAKAVPPTVLTELKLWAEEAQEVWLLLLLLLLSSFRLCLCRVFFHHYMHLSGQGCGLAGQACRSHREGRLSLLRDVDALRCVCLEQCLSLPCLCVNNPHTHTSTHSPLLYDDLGLSEGR